MVSLGFAPNWFSYQSIIFELVFAIITLFVAFAAFRIYYLSKEKSAAWFGSGFLFFSISYILQSILNIGILFRLSETVDIIGKAREVINLGITAQNLHMILMITGLVIIAHISMKSKSLRNLLLLLAVTLTPMYFSHHPIFLFFMLSSILLGFITLSYLFNYLERKRFNTYLVFSAFLLLFLSNVLFIFSMQSTIFYVIAHFFELFSYLLMLINLTMCLKK
jgi:hypothetical protein